MLTTVIVVTVTATSTSCVFNQPYLCADAFTPAPKVLLTVGEIEFNRLGTSKLSLVRVSPPRAIQIAESQYGGDRGSRVVYESLGGYIDKNRIIPDWVGTTSWVPKPIPSYIVRIHYSHVVATVDPSNNHFWNVIVNATNGTIIAAYTYD